MLTRRKTPLVISLLLLVTSPSTRAEVQLDLNSLGSALQSGDTAVAHPAALAVDGSTLTYSETPDAIDSFWEFEMVRFVEITHIEIVAASSAANGLVLRIEGLRDQTLFQATVTGLSGAGGTWSTNLPAAVNGRIVRLGLEGGQSNGVGDRRTILSEVRVYGDPVPGDTGSNLALGADSYMVRLTDSLPPPGNANDGNYATFSESSTSTVDAYWEVDLGVPRALYSVRVVAADGTQAQMTHATVRLYDGAHASVLSQHLGGTSETFDVPLPGAVLARYVRVGLENKEETSSVGSHQWHIGMKEVEAWGRSSNEVGILVFSSEPPQITAGASAQLLWQEKDLYSTAIYPGIGSVGSFTDRAGLGALTVWPTSSTEYLLVGSNYSGHVTRSYTVEVDGQELPARISEFVANNKYSLRDGDKAYPDWIELHNPNNSALDLTGYGLSDDPTKPMKFVFPSGVSIAAHDYLIAFADGQDEPFDAAGFLHANFSLNQDGESVVLTASNGVSTVDSITNFPPQREDLAYGRTLDGQWTFLEPTPGAPNVATSYVGWLEPIAFSHKRGWYSNAFSLVLSNANPLSQVYWSTNGTEPTNLYSASIAVADTVSVRATVRRDGYKSPRTKTHSHLFLDGIVASPVMSTTYTQSPAYTNRLRQGLLDLPTFCISVAPAPAGLGSERPEREASLEIFMPDGSRLQENCGIVHYGGAWGNASPNGNPYAKKSWQLKFRKEFGASKLEAPLFVGFDHGILARDSFDELDLLAGNHDMTSRGFYLSHRFAADTLLDMGSLNPHGRFVHLYINGVYWGQYDAHERLTDAFLSEYLGGAKEDYVSVKGNDNAGNNFVTGTPDPLNRDPWEWVRANRSAYASVRTRLDVTNLIDFMLVWNWGNAEAEFRCAGAVAPVPGGGFKFWIADADGHLRNSGGVGGQLSKNGTGNSGPGQIFGALLAEADPDFKTLLADRIYHHFFNGGAMTPEANLARLNLRMSEITNSMVAECARWGYLGGRTPVNWQSDAQSARDNLFPYRNGNLLTYMRNAGWYPAVEPPQLSQYGGSVSNGYTLKIQASGGTLYYTLDGTDPRLSGGGISPSAIAWTGGQTGQPISLPLGSDWRWLKGTSEASSPTSAWRGTNFDDSAWLNNFAPFQYGYTGGTTLNDMRSNYTCVYLRSPFVVSNVAAVDTLRLSVQYDDGFVAWVNGSEVARSGVSGTTLPYITTADINHEASLVEVFTSLTPQNFLVTGTNVLAVQAFNRSLTGSTDFLIDLGLEADLDTSAYPAHELVLTNEAVITARVFDGTTWSALVQSSFVVAPLRQPGVGDLLISEINYNPPGDDNFEFIELYNHSTNLLDLGGVRLTDGVDFLFPVGFYLAPGAFTLVVENAQAFAQRYGTNASPYYHAGLLVAGEWSGQLSNGGERLALVASNTMELAAVSYGTGGLWPDRADGRGSTLELRDPFAASSTNASLLNAHLGRGANWRSSAAYFGTPGWLDMEARNLVISEVVAHTDVGVDWVELQNTTGTPVSLANCYLSDDFDQPFRYAFAGNISIPAGGYLIRNATELGFGFSELGSDILFIEANGTNIMRFADTTDIPAVEREEPFGRYTRSDAVVDFTELRSKTQGGSNDLPRIGPVVFSEIMFNPTNGNSEFVELLNLTSTNVTLYDPSHSTNTWELSGAVSYRFPSGQQIAPGAMAIVCATNPAVFRTQYGVSPSLPVYGPWTGALNNAGESLRLRRPGDPEPNGFVPYYRVDHVCYEPILPWPVMAAGGGASLERVPSEGYGNDPLNWQASTPGGTPGALVANRPPFLAVNGNTTVDEGAILSFTVYASDLDEPWQTLAVSADNLPLGAVFNPSDGQLTWATDEADGPGTYSLWFVAADSGLVSATTTQMVAVTIQEVNLPPKIQPIGNPQFAPGEPVVINVSASDPDLPLQSLSYSATGLPVGLEVNPLTGQITGSTVVEGIKPVTVFVSDNGIPPLIVNIGFYLIIGEAFGIEWSGMSPGGQPQFSFMAKQGDTYEVYWTDTLSPPDWQLLERITNAPAGSHLIPDGPDTNAAQHFLRVLWIENVP